MSAVTNTPNNTFNNSNQTNYAVNMAPSIPVNTSSNNAYANPATPYLELLNRYDTKIVITTCIKHILRGLSEFAQWILHRIVTRFGNITNDINTLNEQFRQIIYDIMHNNNIRSFQLLDYIHYIQLEMNQNPNQKIGDVCQTILTNWNDYIKDKFGFGELKWIKDSNIGWLSLNNYSYYWPVKIVLFYQNKAEIRLLGGLEIDESDILTASYMDLYTFKLFAQFQRKSGMESIRSCNITNKWGIAVNEAAQGTNIEQSLVQGFIKDGLAFIKCNDKSNAIAAKQDENNEKELEGTNEIAHKMNDRRNRKRKLSNGSVEFVENKKRKTDNINNNNTNIKNKCNKKIENEFDKMDAFSLGFDEWLLNEVKLSQYKNNFVTNELYDARMIEFIDNETLKDDIGIEKSFHRQLILKKVEDFKKELKEFHELLDLSEELRKGRKLLEDNGILRLKDLRKLSKEDLNKILQSNNDCINSIVEYVN